MARPLGKSPHPPFVKGGADECDESGDFERGRRGIRLFVSTEYAILWTHLFMGGDYVFSRHSGT